MPQPQKNPYILSGQLATFVSDAAGAGTTAPPPPTITTTWATFAAALGVSAPLSLRVAKTAVGGIRMARP